MPRIPMRHIGLPTLFLSGLLALAGDTCGTTPEGCNVEPAGYLNVFFPKGEREYPRSLTARVAGIVPASDGSAHLIALSDSAGAPDTLYLDAIGTDPPLEAGNDYTFEVEYAPGFPSLSGVIIRDGQGILYAGVTDRSNSPRIFASGIPGFDVALADAGCPDRKDKPCYDAIRNMRLDVTRAGQTAGVRNNETARLGDYEVTCLAAQRLVYSSDCADAGLPSYSFVLVRRAPDQETKE